VPAGALLLLDAGFIDFACYRPLTQASVTLITRAKSNLAFTVVRPFTRTATWQDTLVWVGKGQERQQLRLIAVWARGTWYRYLTNELDPSRLPAAMVVALYACRWRIEDAFAAVKRLLGLAYFWVGAENWVQLQVWATWLLDAVLVDLTDAVAEGLQRPFADLSLEMVYRAVYYATQAFHRGETTDAVAYLAAHAKLLGIIKRPRKQKSAPDEPDRAFSLLAGTAEQCVEEKSTSGHATSTRPLRPESSSGSDGQARRVMKRPSASTGVGLTAAGACGILPVVSPAPGTRFHGTSGREWNSNAWKQDVPSPTKRGKPRAPVAQRIRAKGCGPLGRGFESLRAHLAGVEPVRSRESNRLI
jgi:hypothetical protein